MFSVELLAGFVGFAVVTLFSPGPNNLMLMASGLNYGFARTQPHVVGVAFGFGFLNLMVGLGLGAAFATYPALYAVLKYVGAAYLLFLAWKVATAGPPSTEGQTAGRPMTFLQAAAFQWVNPKAWAMALGAIASFAAIADYPTNVIGLAAIFTSIGLVSAWTWVLLGLGVRRIVGDERLVRVINGAMALLLVASLIPVFMGAGG